jgi:phosphomannomutase
MPDKGGACMIVSVSGIRGIPNKDLLYSDAARFASNFAGMTGSGEVLLARDTRSTGPAISRAVASGLMAKGARVLDYGVISTPALFRESRVAEKPAVMVTASHNEPEYNGLKFLIDGIGIGRETIDAVVADKDGGHEQFRAGSLRSVPRSSYADDLVARFGAGSCDAVRVALDLGGGAAITQAPRILRGMGCKMVSVNDAMGVFSRKVDPVADELVALRKLVKETKCDIGLAFDCDGDRLVIVDDQGKKRTGDYMLTLALAEMLGEGGDSDVVVSQDTTQAVDEVVERLGGEVFRSRVGEANVVGMMREKGVTLGGEGSSGGLIDSAFNYCRDSMLAALVIVKALRTKGRNVYSSVPVYHQERVALELPRAKALKGIRKLAGKYRDGDTSDGLKVALSEHSWVLIRPSGTEDLVRVSAEAETASKAAEIAKSFASKLKELSS